MGDELEDPESSNCSRTVWPLNPDRSAAYAHHLFGGVLVAVWVTRWLSGGN